jgi:hypothetical protein
MQSSNEQCGTQVRKPSVAINSDWQTKSDKQWRKLMNRPTAKGNVLRFYYVRLQLKLEGLKSVSN